MIIQTERLELILLTPNQLKLWSEDISALEIELDCSYRGELMEGSFLNIVKNQYEIAKKDIDNYLWHSFFLLIRKKDRVVVGSSDFKHIPNENGEVEIGYGLGKEFEHNGYMTEAVQAMCDFAVKQNNAQINSNNNIKIKEIEEKKTKNKVRSTLNFSLNTICFIISGIICIGISML